MTNATGSGPQSAPYGRGPASFEALVSELRPAARATFVDRAALLAGALVPDASDRDDHGQVIGDVVGTDPARLWLAFAVLVAELPTDDDMAELLVRARLGGPWAALQPLAARTEAARRHRTVEIRAGGVLCDVHTTAQSRLLSGIQRVVRETTSRWETTKPVTFVGWTSDGTGLRRLRDDERRRVFQDPADDLVEPGVAPVIVPWQATHLCVEVVDDLRRSSRLAAMAHHSSNELGVLGYDCIPVTSASTVDRGTTAFFSRTLATARRADRVAMISPAAAEEFRGVMDMGSGRRDRGPEVAAVPLAVHASIATDADVDEARRGLVVDGLPMALVVGSHEPRKNHLAVLHAADQLWRQGVDFSLVFVGAGSWGADAYEQKVAALQAAGRPLQSIRGLPDRLLWAAYRLAHVTLFPSLNEGFGLPVAESLAVGTPVITSAFGSMRDILAPAGRPLGGLLVDPRDDGSITEAMRSVLTDRDLRDRLAEETREHAVRTWDTYAAELWDFLVDGDRPPADPAEGAVR